MIIIDDIIDKEEQELIKETLLGRDFNWHYCEDVTFLDGKQKRPGFSHYFILKEQVTNQKVIFLSDNFECNGVEDTLKLKCEVIQITNFKYENSMKLIEYKC